MAKVLSDKIVYPDLIISSTAVRAFEFALILAKHFDYKKKNIFSTKDLYLADADEMLRVAREIGDEYKSVFLVSHNPGITYFANSLCSCNIDNIPTSGIAAVKFDMDKWKDVAFGKGEFDFFEYPRKYY